MNIRKHLGVLAILLFPISYFLLPVSAQNPYLPLGEFIPDGEPYVFDDPDCPGKQRVYIYGSHDILKTAYCGKDQVVWSASTDDLTHWRYDGVIFESKKDANGNMLHEDGSGDVLFAPDVAVKKNADGKPVYYLYPNNQAGGRQGMVCKSNRPDGPFEVCNWAKTSPLGGLRGACDGVLRFDPGVFVDDDGRAYGYWGFNESYGAELDTATMATVKAGTEIKNLIPGKKQDDLFRFFEASSIRKIKDKYVLIYSRWTKAGDFGMPESNYTLAYCYSNNPLGPFTYGGTIIDGRGREPFPTPIREVALQTSPLEGLGDGGIGKTSPLGGLGGAYTACPTGNTHGSICEINGKWYVFYHRQSGTCEYNRQAMVAPITVEVKEGKDGYVKISEGEYTSEGFQTDGLDPYQKYPAGIACYYTGPEGAHQEYPKVIYSGSHPDAIYSDYSHSDYSKRRGQTLNGSAAGPLPDPYADATNQCPMVNNTAGSVIGYKYFSFDKLRNHKTQDKTSSQLCLAAPACWLSKERTCCKKNLTLLLDYTPEGVAGNIDIYFDRPTTTEGGKKIGSLKIPATGSRRTEAIQISPLGGLGDGGIDNTSPLGGLGGAKHALFLVFSSKEKGKSICKLNTIQFK